MTKWLQEVGSKYKGSKIRFVSEPTPPTVVASLLAREEFTANTGIEVDIEIVPLEQVLQKAAVDVRDKAGAYDLYYLDQSWTALFAGDTVDPRETYDRKKDLALPDFDWGDFSRPLLQGISTYKDKLIGIPFDIPIFILMYRKDLFDKHRLKVPTTMAEYMDSGEGARRRRARQRHPWHHRPAESRPLLPQLRLDGLAMGQRRLGIRQGRAVRRRR